MIANTQLTRRSLLRGGLAVSAAAISTTAAIGAPVRPTQNPVETARDETFWQSVAAQYDVTDEITNLENGYWGLMSRPALKEYQRLTAWVNHKNTAFARFDWGETLTDIHARLASFLNVDASEIVLTRGATEALQALIGGYNKLKAGDTVLYADLDYREMKNAMRWLANRRGVNPVKVNFPEPAADKELVKQDILDFYEQALDANPKTKLLLLTHLNNLTGLIIPVAEIADMARNRGIDVILDAAHSVGQVDFDIKATGCDFVGINLHKWIGAPIGCGVLYIKKGRATDIDTFMGRNPGSERTADRIDTGTLNFAAHMAVPAALDFHETIGTAHKEARLRYLRSLWVEKARQIKGLTVLTPDNPSMVAGLTSFRFDGVTSAEENLGLMRRLADEFGVLTTRRTGPAAGDCIRVTPSMYNKPEDALKLADALEKISTNM